MNGVFISFEGSEGCGKTTQIERLEQRLIRMGRHVVVVREPGGTAVGEEIRNLLKFSKANRLLTPESELLLFAASRAQLVREVIRPELDRGTVILCDRFLDSTTAYQGVARRIPAEDVYDINTFAVDGCLPQLTLYLDLDPAIGFQRARRRPAPVGVVDRMEQEPLEFYEKVRAGYLELVRAHPRRIKLVDASPSLETVEAALWEIVKPVL
ncbi:MAG: dTMP kinase [Verrucomicrobiae bacterium]|nr:dTMP kinase [Verrucomicrobiae bacterium]